VSDIVLKRQFITDAKGNPVAVILPLEQFAAVEEILEQRFPFADDADKIERMQQAARDPRFLADLQETMSAFGQVDGEWWEPEK
jgi:hypothetical protein